MLGGVEDRRGCNQLWTQCEQRWDLADPRLRHQGDGVTEEVGRMSSPASRDCRAGIDVLGLSVQSTAARLANVVTLIANVDTTVRFSAVFIFLVTNDSSYLGVAGRNEISQSPYRILK